MSADVEATLAKWTDGFDRNDGAAIAALYTSDALFIGGIGGVHQGPAAIAAYFTTHTSPATVIFRDVTVRPHGPDMAIIWMIGSIGVPGGERRDFRFLQTHVRTPDGWRIAGHHGSSSL